MVLQQGAPAYALSVPLAVRTAGGDKVQRVELSREHQTFSVSTDAEPSAIVLDPDQRVLRALSPDEAPPILREAMLAEKPQLYRLGDDALRQAGSRLAERLLENEPDKRGANDAPGKGAAVVMGPSADIDRWLQARGLPARPANVGSDRGTAQVWTLRAGGAMLLVVSARDAQALAALAAPLPHYGQQSFLVFEGARMAQSGVWPANPQTWPLR